MFVLGTCHRGPEITQRLHIRSGAPRAPAEPSREGETGRDAVTCCQVRPAVSGEISWHIPPLSPGLSPPHDGVSASGDLPGSPSPHLLREALWNEGHQVRAHLGGQETIPVPPLRHRSLTPSAHGAAGDSRG